jgi:hypothetical protein
MWLLKRGKHRCGPRLHETGHDETTVLPLRSKAANDPICRIAAVVISGTPMEVHAEAA